MTANSGCPTRWWFAAIAVLIFGGVTASNLWLKSDSAALRCTNEFAAVLGAASCSSGDGASDKAIAVDAIRALAPSTVSLKLPNAFAANLGQWDESIRFAGSAYGATARFLDDGWSLAVPTGSDPTNRRIAQVRFRHQGEVGRDLRPRGVAALPGYYNYFLGDEPSRWQHHVQVFGSIEFSSESSGLRVAVYDNGEALEYDLIVPELGLLGKFTIECDGISALRLDTDGSLLLAVDDDVILRQQPPVAFLRKADGKTVELAPSYRLIGERSFGFTLDDDIEHVPGDVVVIDPVMTWATYYGGSGNEDGLAVATDGGLVTVAGETDSSDMPMAGSSFQPTLNAQRDVFVGRFDPTLSGSAQLVWATFYGGAGLDGGTNSTAIAMSSGGDVAVIGATDSANLPIIGAHSQLTTLLVGPPKHGFVALIRNDGAACLYSSYLQVTLASDPIGVDVHDVAIDSNNRIAVVGGAGEGLLAVNAYDSQHDGSSTLWHDAFLSVFDPSLSGNSSLTYSSYLDGAAAGATPAKDEANAVEFDSGKVHVAGYAGNGFQLMNPFMPHSWMVSHSYGFILALDISLAPASQLAYATYFGATGSFTEITDIAVSGNVYYATGRTAADNLPVSTSSSAFEAAAFQPTNPRDAFLVVDEDAFVLKLNPQLTPQLRYCTYLGGAARPRDSGVGIVRRSARSVVVAGWTGSSDFPVSVGADNSTYSNGEGFLTCLDWGNQIPPSSQLLYSTFVGGSDNDFVWDLAADGPAYFVTGHTSSLDFPTTSGGFQPTAPQGANAFVARFSLPASFP